MGGVQTWGAGRGPAAHRQSTGGGHLRRRGRLGCADQKRRGGNPRRHEQEEGGVHAHQGADRRLRQIQEGGGIQSLCSGPARLPEHHQHTEGGPPHAGYHATGAGCGLLSPLHPGGHL